MIRSKSILSNLAVLLASVLIFLSLTGMSWIRNSGSIHVTASTPPVLAQVAGTASLTETPVVAAADAPDETLGIILAGAILVLIILGGTFGATRRRKS